MAIEVRCPNGHKIVCPDEGAGRAAKCPRCAAPFRIPSQAASNGAEGGQPLGLSPDPATGVKPPSGINQENRPVVARPADTAGEDGTALASGSKIGAANSPAGPPVEADTILFLCPSGHKLSGPKRLAGKTGKCPHCQVRFVIPLPDEGPWAEEGAEGESRGAEPSDPDDEVLHYDEEELGLAPLDEDRSRIAGEKKAAPRSPSRTQESPIMLRSGGSSVRRDMHPLADLVARIWAEREQGAVVELHLAGDVILIPEWFDLPLSQKSHGLFAAQAADGTVTMTIVSWDSVQRVVVRGVSFLPDGMFE